MYLVPEAFDVINSRYSDKDRDHVHVVTLRKRKIHRINNTGWRIAKKAAGLNDIRVHDLRRRWASWHLQAGTTIDELIKIGGWASPEIVRKHYAHLAPEQLRTISEYVWDIMPTILDIAGVEYPAQFRGQKIEAVRGRSMVGLVDGTKETIYDEKEFVGGEMGKGKWMRQGDFKALMVPKPYGTGDWRLFNVIADPGEANDLSKAMPEKLETLKAAWEQYASDVGVVLGE